MPEQDVNCMKQRVYLERVATAERAYLAWFELTETHDLYWGAPTAGLDAENMVIEPDGSTGLLNLRAPDDWEQLPSARHKHTYHRSGRRHTTAEGSGAAAIPDSGHVPLDALIEPALLCAVLTAIPDKYPRYQRNPNRGNSRAVIFGMDDTLWSNWRHYFEFYVAPSGAYLPPPLVNTSALKEQQPWYSSLSVDLDRILAIRHIQVPLAEDHRTNMVSFWHIPGGQRQVVREDESQ
jgi:hypothetical protein